MAPPPYHKNHMYGRGVNLVIICIVLNSIAAMLVVSRLIARLHVMPNLVRSDWVIVASCVSSYSFPWTFKRAEYLRTCQERREPYRVHEGH